MSREVTGDVTWIAGDPTYGLTRDATPWPLSQTPPLLQSFLNREYGIRVQPVLHRNPTSRESRAGAEPAEASCAWPGTLRYHTIQNAMTTGSTLYAPCREIAGSRLRRVCASQPHAAPRAKSGRKSQRVMW